MKHLFYIHSQITFLVSIKVIKLLKLKNEDCVFIVHRGKVDDYKTVGIKKVEFSYNGYNIETYSVYKKFWKSWIRVSVLDKFINYAVANNDFTFYTPQSYAGFLALIITHKRCKGFNIIEEGLGSYLKQGHLAQIFPERYHSAFFKILWKINFFNRMKINRPFIEAGYIHAFGFTQESFPDYSRKIIIGLPTLSDYDAYGNSNHDKVYSNILVYDGLVEANALDSGTLVMSTLILLRHLIRNGEKTLHVKYHPDQIRAGKTIILLKELFDQMNEIEVVEILQNQSLEEIALKQDATFFVFVSSVGLYASFYNRKVNSLCKILEKLHPEFSYKVDALPSIFKDRVNFI